MEIDRAGSVSPTLLTVYQITFTDIVLNLALPYLKSQDPGFWKQILHNNLMTIFQSTHMKFSSSM